MVEKVQRVAAYAVIVRDGQILLSRLAPHVSREPIWTLPGGGLEHGEDPRDAVVREVHEETGLPVTVGEGARTFSLHLPDTWRKGRRVDAHSLRIVYDGWVPADCPAPQVVEVDGSTVEAAWKPVADVQRGTVPTVSLVREALASYRPHRRQRVAAYVLVRRGEEVLLTRNSVRGPRPGMWVLPGGGVEHGETPREAAAREVLEEAGCKCDVGPVLAVENVLLRGTAPSGRDEDYQSIALIFSGVVSDDAEPRVLEVDGTTDAAAWTPVREVETGAVPVVGVVLAALAADKAH